MLESLLSFGSAAVLVLLGMYLLITKTEQRSNLVFSIFLFLLSGLEVVDRLTLTLNPGLRFYSMFIESLLPGTVLLLSIMLSRKAPYNTGFFTKLALVTSIAFPVSVFVIGRGGFYYAPDIQTERIAFLTREGYFFYLGVMLYFILSLINLEATFVSTRGSERWRLKYIFMGLLCIVAMEIFYTSQALLYRTLNLNLLTARSVVFIMGALLIGYSKLYRGNNVAIAVSRFVLYRSIGLLSVGLYLLVLGIAGEGLKYTGINYSETLLLIFGFLFGIALFAVLFSEQVRRRIKVFINKHFYTHKHDYRTQWLGFTERLSHCRDTSEIEEAITETFKETFGLKGAMLFTIDRGSGLYRSRNPSVPALPEDTGLIRYFKERKRVFNADTDEYQPDEAEREFIDKTGAFLIIPLQKNGDVVGFVLCGEQLIREELTFEDYDLMKTLAKQATLAVLNQHLSEEVAETRQLAAVAKVSSFVIHDLKNMASTLSLMLDNAAEFIDDPEFQQDMLDTLKSTVEKMRSLMNRLKDFPEKQRLSTQQADLALLTEEALRGIKNINGGVKIIKTLNTAPATVDPEEFKKVVLNLVLNAFEATEGSGGEIRIETGTGDGAAFLKVSDTGKGMSEEFLKGHLFKPFSTTKKKGLGIGLYQCKQIIEAHRGTIKVKSALNRGTEFIVSLPAESSPALTVTE